MTGPEPESQPPPETTPNPESEPERRPFLQWLAAWMVLAVLILGALFVAATIRLFVLPPTDAPKKVDAIVALGGDRAQTRAKQGVALAEAGYAPVVIVSLGGYPPDPCPSAKAPVHVICFRANPLNTRGEVEYAARLARARHWTSLMMVPEQAQATRARMLFRRCSSVPLVVVPVNDGGFSLLYDIAYEWASLAKALVVHTSC
jgi:uncharacterized SAM-binding protein YcdF (DUF218 family)